MSQLACEQTDESTFDPPTGDAGPQYGGDSGPHPPYWRDAGPVASRDAAPDACRAVCEQDGGPPAIVERAACDPGRVRPAGGYDGLVDDCAHEDLDCTACMEDADCTEGAQGRCIRAGISRTQCTYDHCYTDEDCGAGAACACGEGSVDANVCVPAEECTRSDDCGGYACAVSPGCMGHESRTYVEAALLCHGPDDECQSDEDCTDAGEFCTRGVAPGGYGTERRDYWFCDRISCSWD